MTVFNLFKNKTKVRPKIKEETIREGSCKSLSKVESKSDDSVECKLSNANKLKENIDNIDNFLLAAERVWTGTLVSSSYGVWESRSINLDTELKNEMLEVLRKRRQVYVEDIQRIMEFK